MINQSSNPKTKLKRWNKKSNQRDPFVFHVQSHYSSASSLDSSPIITRSTNPLQLQLCSSREKNLSTGATRLICTIGATRRR
ncbi:hypothetical protein Scep_007309 [Stephania cephalantha]|uniref:Uncharacterized protein n=1 Tax=Stephania cephalantha TaxID=152367 RepID=A0AAP0PLN8_9MAGN